MTSSFSQPIICPILVGREDALAALYLIQQQSAHAGRVALISGEAGIGKSRLLAQFLAESRVSEWLSVVAPFFEQDSSLPYSGIRRLLGELASRPDTSEAVLLFASDLALVFPEAVRLAAKGIVFEAANSGDAQADKLRVLEALAGLIRVISSNCQIVLAFEDIHWADASSLEALLYISRQAPARRLIALTYRDDEVNEDLNTLFAELERARISSEIRLQGLGVTHVDGMLKACLETTQSTRADVLHSIHQLTSGNPFFVEELTRSILDRLGSVQSLNTSQFADIELPRGLNEVVRRRKRELSQDARDLLELAAVIGVRFELALLAEIAGRETQQLLAVIKELVAAQFVTEESEDQFVFRHALTREAIRSELLRRERRALSLQIGTSMERLYAGEEDKHLEDLSRHFFEAGEWARAFGYSLRAGRRAMDMYAAGSALTHLSRAIAAGARLGSIDLADAERLRGSAYEALGDFEGARSCYEKAASSEGSDLQARWRALLDLGALWAARDYSTAESPLREALQLARDLDDAAKIAHSLNRLGNWHLNSGDPESAQAMSEEALAIFRQLGDESGIAQTLDFLGITCCLGLRFEDAVSYYREAISRLEALGDKRTLASSLASIQIGSSTRQTDMLPPAISLKEGSDFGARSLAITREMESKADECYALWQLAFSTGPQGHGFKALEYAREALAIARDIEHTQWEAGAECSVGSALSDLLAAEEAKLHLRRAVELGVKMSSQLWTAQAQAMLIDALLIGHETEEAFQLFESAATDEIRGFGPLELYASGADAVLALGDPERALAMLQRLDAEAERSGPGKPALRLMRTRGRALLAIGDLDASRDLMEAARTAAREQGNVSHLWRLCAELAHCLVARGERENAREAAAEAIELIELVAGRINDEVLRSNFREKAFATLPAALRPRRPSLKAGLLTARELEIARLVAQGMTSREIADRLVLSVRTVESHIGNALSKLGYASRAQLAAWAVEHP